MKSFPIIAFLLLFGLEGTYVPTYATDINRAKTKPQLNPLKDPVIQALDVELKRNFRRLKKAGKTPLYFLAYRLYEGTWESITARYGALDNRTLGSSWRISAIDLRVGSPQFDNSHYMRSNRSHPTAIFDNSTYQDSCLPTHGAGLPLRQAFWLKTNEAFKAAQARYLRLKASKDVLAEEDDKSADFSIQPMHLYQSKFKKTVDLDRKEWEKKLRRVSRLFLGNPVIQTSSITFNAHPSKRYIVTSEGSQIVEKQPRYTIAIKASSLANDGMGLSLWKTYAAREPSRLPVEKKLIEEAKKIESTLEALCNSKPAEPYVGPAIFSGSAAAVFFHETFGHRIESIHEKSENEGKTFSKKIGEQVMPKFMSVVDDPTISEAYGEQLGGHYVYDDEGVPGQPVNLAVNGTLTGFLLGRMLVEGFSTSNGHGRSAPGWNPMARQSNLFVRAEKNKQVAPKKLRKMLIKEARKQKKSYGLYFRKVSGGYTWTARGSLQTFSVKPLLVYKVFVDGRPDELIRGVDMVGTPLSALEHIIAAGDDYAVFNGVCGRESGKVPVSAVAPSILVDSIEIKRKAKSFQKPPILSDPSIPINNKTEKQ